MFLTVEWAKRRLPAVLLLLSLFLPWWTMIDLHSTGTYAEAETYYFPPFERFTLSFLWSDSLRFFVYTRYSSLCVSHYVKFFNIPFLFVVSSLILLSALCGLSDEKRTRTLGGLLGIGSVIFYFIWRFVFPPFRWVSNFYFGIGEYRIGITGLSSAVVGTVWFLSIGFYLAAIGSVTLLAFRTGTSMDRSNELNFLRLKELIFLSIGWIKRRLPTIFLLMSLFIPWWVLVYVPPGQGWSLSIGRHLFHGIWSFPWEEVMEFEFGSVGLVMYYGVQFYFIPYVIFVCASILVAGLCGLSSKDRTRTLGGLLGMVGIVSYSIIILPESVLFYSARVMGNPFFGIYPPVQADYYYIWFLSFGLYLALAGSIMLLLPTTRTLIERLRKRL
jgi:hypothetical protein